jgi:hypothetical protein
MLMLLTRIHSHAKDEQGAVLVLFAVFAPVAVLFVAFVIDVGNTLLHARHLQVQADAGALAAAREFQPCINGNIYSRAAQYSGAEGVTTPSGSATALTPLYNTQVGGTTQANIHVLLNSKRYYKQSSPVDASAEEKPPCEAMMIDVKATETDQAWYIKVFKSIFNGISYDNAHARIELLQETEPTGVEPLAIANSAPIAARAYFVDEDENSSGVATVEKGKALASVALANSGPNGAGQDVWSNATAPLTLAIAHPHIGVVIALSGRTSDTQCGHEYVKCFDATERSLLHIAGYSEGGTGTLTTPIAHKVTLSSPLPNTCTDGYFSNSSTTCTFTIAAKVDYGSTKTKGISVIPVVKGKQETGLTYVEAEKLWRGTASLQGAGSNEINLLIKCNKNEKESPCEKASSTEATIKDVQRSYAASEAGSGTIKGAWLGEIGGLLQDANAFEVCEAQNGNSCSHKLVVTINVGGSLADAQKYSDPLYHMRFGNPQAEVVGCTPGGESSGAQYRENLSVGCQNAYKLNTTDPGCTATGEPFDCVGFASGVKTGPFAQGLSDRLQAHPPEGTQFYKCNNWVKNNGENVPLIPADDSRVIQLFVEPYASNGSRSAPIQDFATFYVTGWDGDNSSCPGHPDDSAAKGEVVGHFIKYVDTLNSGDGGGQKCVLNSLEQCVTVQTR